MAYRVPMHVMVTSTTVGVDPYVLDPAVSDFLEPSPQMADGDTAHFSIFEASGATVNWEYILGTFLTGPNRIERTAVLASSNGGAAVSWTSGTRVILAGVGGPILRAMIDPGLGNGIVVKDTTNSRVVRTITGTTKLPVTNGSGVGGNPTLVQSWLDAHVLDRDASAALADRTMAGRLVLAAARTALLLTSSKHTLGAADDGSDPFLEIEKQGANDYLARLRVLNSWRDLVFRTASGDNHAETADTLAGWDPSTDESDWDAVNDRGTLLLPGGFRVNFGHGTLVGTDAPGSTHTDFTYHTAFGSDAYIALPLVSGVTTIAGDAETGISSTWSLTGVTVHHANGFTGRVGGYVAIGHD